MKELLVLIVTALCLSSCTQEQKVISANGIWQQLGYGKVIEIQGDSIWVYDKCAIDCSLYEQTLLADEGKVFKLTEDSLVIKKNIKTYQFLKLDKLPTLCTGQKEKSLSPVHNFEVLWNTFNENYCYFKERNIDWNKTHDRFRSQVSEETSDIELFMLFEKMLSEMKDGHVSIDAPESLEEALSSLVANSENQEEPEAVEQLVDQFLLSDMITNRYCKDCKSYNAGIVKWGHLDDSIAYLQVNAMWLMANYDIPQGLSLNEFGAHYMPIAGERTFQRQDEIDGAREIMKAVFTDLQDSKALIVDLRFNQGGKDEVGMEIIGHLVKDKVRIASKKARLENSFTNHQDIFIESRLPYYDKSVYVLTSIVTGSAAELATLSTFPLNNVIRIGSRTEGIFSDGLDKKLPIGWEYRMSNEIYMALDGKSYEDIGIPPHIDLGYPSDKANFINLLYKQISETEDAAIQRVIELESEKKMLTTSDRI